jgi:hypothetical protein
MLWRTQSYEEVDIMTRRLPLLFRAGQEGKAVQKSVSFVHFFRKELPMKLQLRPQSLFPSVLGACTVLLFTGALAQAQIFHQLDWGTGFNNSVSTDTEDNWVANSFMSTGSGNITSITLPIADTFTGDPNQPITGLIYQGFDLQDPTAGGGLLLMGQKTVPLTTIPGSIVTITFDNPVAVTPENPFTPRS